MLVVVRFLVPGLVHMRMRMHKVAVAMLVLVLDVLVVVRRVGV